MAVDNLSFIGVGRFRGYWNASTNSGTLTADGGYDSDRGSGVPLLNTGSGKGASTTAGAFHTASSGGGVALTGSAGDYFQVSVAGSTIVDGESGWQANDYLLLKSGSSGQDFKWIRLSHTDTVSSVIQGGINSASLANSLFAVSGVADTQVLTARIVDGTSSFSGSNNLIFRNSSNELVLTGTLVVSGAVQSYEYKSTIVSASVIYQSGSTKFGNTSDDIHDFTGSVYLGHNLFVTGNIDANGTITCDDSITIDSVTISDTELAYLDGLTLGTVAASKVITVDTNKDFAGHRNMSGSGILQNVGNVILGSARNVSGTTTLAGHTNTQALEATTLSASSAIEGGSTLALHGGATIRGDLTTKGSVTLGDGTSDDITISGRISSNIIPNSTHNLGSAADEFGSLFLQNISGSGIIRNVGSISGSGDLAVTGAIHANAFYGDGSGLSGVDSVSGSSRHYSTTGFETSGYLKVTGSSTLGHALPIADITYDLGSPAKRWRNIYTGDLHLRNDRGDWTVIEEEDYLTITNNKNGKRYKLLMEEI